MGRTCRPKKSGSYCCPKESFKQMGFVLVVFGLITICAFFLPLKAWIVLLGILLIICGVKLLK